MKPKKSSQVVALAALAALSLTACITGGSGEPTTTTQPPSDTDTTDAAAELSGELEVVSFYPVDTPDYRRLEGLAEAFQDLHPDVTVTLTFGGGQDVPQIEARWRAGDPPEVNYGFFDPSRADGGDWVAEGKVVPLTPAMNEPLEGYDSTWIDAIQPGVRPLISSGDEIYAAPESVTTLQFFYNAALFDELGLDAPTTFDELIDVADAVKAAGVAPFTVTGTFLPYMQLYWDYLALRHIGLDGMLQALSGESELAQLPGAAEAAADMERLTSNDYFLTGFRGVDFTSAQMSFFQGDAAMILMGSWLVGEMADAIPEDFQIGTFAFPTVADGLGDAQGLFGGVNAQLIAADSANHEAGIAWLKFVAAPENQQAYVEATGGISPYAGTPAPEGFENVVQMLETGSAFAPSYLGIFSQSQDVQNAYQQPIGQLFFGEIDGATMLSTMSEGLLAAPR